MTTPCYYCEEDRKTACRVCIHDYDGPTPEEVIAWKRDAERYRFVRVADRVPISAEAARDPVAYDRAIDAAAAAREGR